MTDKLLPAGHYVVALAAVGGAFTDGGWVSLRLAHPMLPDVIQRATLSAIETFLPKDLEMLPAGAWWHVSIAYQSAWDSGCMLGAQLQLPDMLQSEQFLDALREFMPRATASIAFAMADRFGVEPPAALAAERPALLN